MRSYLFEIVDFTWASSLLFSKIVSFPHDPIVILLKVRNLLIHNGRSLISQWSRNGIVAE